MIYDKTINIAKYKNISGNLKKAIKYIENLDLTDTKEKEFKVDGDNIFGFIRNFDLKENDEVLFETHEKYIDIQVCLDCGEIMGHADKSGLTPEIPYDADKDIDFGNTDRYSDIILDKGTFIILFPNDAHKPCLKLDDYKKTCKLVLKVRNSM